MTTISPMSSTEPTLGVTRRLAIITLRRPAAINAIGPQDIAALTELLRAAVDDPGVETILLRGDGDRGFCAGGDIKRVRELIAAQDHDILADFWASEYRLDHLIATCPKPVVTIAHGLTLGGGMGLASHASHRLVTDSSHLGMPEVLIGLAPDVGGLWLYGRAPGHTGTYAALTAARLGPGDALYMGLADHFVPAAELADVVDHLCTAAPEHVLGGLGERPKSWVAEHRAGIDAVFGAGPVREIAQLAARIAAQDRDDADGSPGPGRAEAYEVAERTSVAFAEASPTALAVTREALARAGCMVSLGDCLTQDLIVSQHFSRHPDLAEGIRARVVDKDRAPCWTPPTLDDLRQDAVAAFFEPIEPLLALPGW